MELLEAANDTPCSERHRASTINPLDARNVKTPRNPEWKAAVVVEEVGEAAAMIPAVEEAVEVRSKAK